MPRAHFCCCKKSSDIPPHSMPYQRSHSLAYLVVFAVRVHSFCLDLFPDQEVQLLPQVCSGEPGPTRPHQGTVLLSSLFLVTSLPAWTEEGSVCDACIWFHPFPKLMTLAQPHLFPSSRKWPFCVPHHLWDSDAHMVSGDPVCLPA